MPPTRAQATRKRGTKRKYRRWDDNPTSRVCFQYRRLAGFARYFRRSKNLADCPYTPGDRRFATAGLFCHFVEPPDLIAYRHKEHGLARVLEQIDNPVVLILQKDR